MPSHPPHEPVAGAVSPRAGGAPTLEALVARTPRCYLAPHAFMVSWQGVLTLAYR
jgi:hypothetical protein